MWLSSFPDIIYWRECTFLCIFFLKNIYVILEWVAISFPRGSSQPRTEWTCVSCPQADSLASEPPGLPWYLFLWLCQDFVAACRLSSCRAQAQLLLSMWGLSSSIRDRTHVPLQGELLTTGPPGKSPHCILDSLVINWLTTYAGVCFWVFYSVPLTSVSAFMPEFYYYSFVL